MRTKRADLRGSNAAASLKRIPARAVRTTHRHLRGSNAAASLKLRPALDFDRGAGLHLRGSNAAASLKRLSYGESYAGYDIRISAAVMPRPH